MTQSNWKKLYKQLKNKPAVAKRFLKHNKPKKRTTGIAQDKYRCQKCGRIGAHVGQYGLNYCRQCFREIAEEIGFKKFS